MPEISNSLLPASNGICKFGTIFSIVIENGVYSRVARACIFISTFVLDVNNNRYYLFLVWSILIAIEAIC